jgi:hypothetical protein
MIQTRDACQNTPADNISHRALHGDIFVRTWVPRLSP